MARSRAALVALAIAAGMLALAEVLVGSGTVIFSLADAGTSRDLLTAGGWVFFAGTAVVVAAVGVVAWGLMVAQRWALVRELAGVAGGALLLAIGALVTVASPRSTAGDILMALGFGAWAVVLLAVAARTSIAGRALPPASPTVSTYWLVAAGALVLLAVSSGLPGPTRSDNTSAIVAGCLGAVGAAVLAAVLLAGRARGLLTSHAVMTAVAGIAVLAAHEIALAAYAGVSFSATSTVTDFRVSATTASFVGAMGFLLLGMAAWQHVDEVPPVGRFAPPAPTGQVGPASPAGPTAPAGQCPRCGAPTAPEARFCSRCGSPLGPPAPI